MKCFWLNLSNMYLVLRAMQILWNPKRVGNSSWKRENDEFLVISLKHISGLTGHANPPGTLNCGQALVLRAIQIPMEPQNRGQLLMKTAIKHQNADFLVITLKHVNCLGTPKLRIIAHENSHKTRKQRDFGHNSQTCNSSYRPCKSPINPNTMGNSSWKMAINTKTTSFWS